MLVWLATFALAGPFAGSYSGTELQLQLSDDGRGGYTGTATLGGTVLPVVAQAGGPGLSGVATTSDGMVPFTVALTQEGALVVSADGMWQVQRIGAPPPTTQAVAVDVIATGKHAQLSRDAADAYYEALVFCLGFAGVGEADRAKITPEVVRQGLTQGFGQLGGEDQVALANARAIWDETRANWARMDAGARKEFAKAVLELAFGEQASKFGGSAGSTANSSTGSLGTVDDMVGVVPGSDCWASAGCADYDAGSGTYTYEEPVIDYGGSYDSY